MTTVQPRFTDGVPSQIVAGKELLEQVRGRLSDDERRIAELRAAGSHWPHIAAELGDNPETLRKRLSRALHHLARDLGL